MVEKKIENLILTPQKSEITEHSVYHKLSQSATDSHNKDVLKQISDDELKHYDFWKKYTRQDAKPNKLSLWKCYLIFKNFRDHLWTYAATTEDEGNAAGGRF